MNPITFTSPSSPLTVEADDTGERRLLAGLAVPWGVVGNTSAGPVEFTEGSLPSAEGVAVVRGHDDGALIGSVKASSSDQLGLAVRSRLSKTALADETLALADDGVLAGFSVSVEPIAYSMRADDTWGQVMVVTEAEFRHLGVVQRPAFADAQITTVAASHTDQKEPTVAEPTTIEPVVDATAPDPVPEPVIASAVVRSEPFPYTFDGSGPSLIRDHVMASEGDRDAASRIMRAQVMLRDPKLVLAASQRMVRLDAATGTTVTQPSIVPPGFRPDLFTPLLSYEAPIYSATTKAPISDFTPFTIPKELTRTGLSATPADEVTPVAAGDITTGLDTITPVHVMGKYAFSRDLALSSNPAIDSIAMNAMNEEWLKDVEARAIAYFEGAGHSTVGTPGGTYTTGALFVKDARARLAAFRINRKAPANVIVTPPTEYLAAVGADDSTARPLLGWDGAPAYNPVGGQSDAAQEANILGVPLLPEGAAPLGAKKTHYIRREDAWCFETPVWNFRFEADGTNPLVITLVKYSGVAFWTRRVQGYVTVLNTGAGPVADAFEADDSSARSAKK